jgi:hypothetical protein
MAATVTARFADADAAREAALELERHGIEANQISVRTDQGRPTNRNTGVADVEVTKDIGGRAIAGGVIGAVAGALVAMAIVLIVGPDDLALALVIAAIGGAALVGPIVGFWSGGSKLPVEPGAYDTYGPDASAATVVVSAADLGAADEIRSVVEPLHPVDLEVEGAASAT